MTHAQLRPMGVQPCSSPTSPPLPCPDARRYRYELPACAASVATARCQARAQLACWAIDGDTADAVILVISELVTNAVVHTTSETIVCELRNHKDRLRIEVQDQGCGAQGPEDAEGPGAHRVPEDERGRGLLLVDALSTAWGVRDTAYGGTRVVWADVPRDGG